MADTLDLKDMTVEQVMALFGVDVVKAEFMIAVARGDVDGDIEVVDEEPD